MTEDLPDALKGADAVVLAVRHSPYLALTPREVLDMTGRPVAIIDCFGILTDDLYPHLYREGLRGQGPGPRPYSADQGKSQKKQMTSFSQS